jgi:hypothetical protein
METQHVKDFARLVEVCKEYNIFARTGEHIHITEVEDFELPQADINCVIKAVKQHTSSNAA